MEEQGQILCPLTDLTGGARTSHRLLRLSRTPHVHLHIAPVPLDLLRGELSIEVMRGRMRGRFRM